MMSIRVLFFVQMVGLLCLPMLGVGQTVEIENAYMNKSIAEKKWDQVELTKRGKAWIQMRKEYPALPYDTVSNELRVQSIITFPGVAKDVAFRRMKEWAALNFGKLSAVIEYEHEASGKAILEGFSPIRYVMLMPNFWGNNKPMPTTVDLYYSLVITMKEGRAKIEYHNLHYKTFVSGYAAAGVYVPGELVSTNFESLFPIVAKDSDYWVNAFEFLKNSMAELNATAPSLEAYIRGADGDYRF